MFLYHQVDTLSQMQRDTSSLVVSDYVELIWYHQQTLQSATLSNVSDSPKRLVRKQLHMTLGQRMYVCVCV